MKILLLVLGATKNFKEENFNFLVSKSNASRKENAYLPSN